MISSNKTIQETLSLLREHGVSDFVLCPGSRNAGIVHSVCDIEDFRAHTATDERCAGFMAIGLALATGRGVAVVVTSGSALANLYPAACEAFYQHVPVIFISADRPAEWLGQMDGQTMPQDGALGKMVKMSVNLPEENLSHTNRLVNEALLCCLFRKPQGPVHINIPISEPIYDFHTVSLPSVRTIRLTDGMQETSLAADAGRGRTVILCGQMPPCEVPDNSIMAETARRFAVIAENLSNISPQYRTNPSLIDWEKMEPADRVITMGGHIINKELKQFFRTHRPAEHWHVSPDGAVADMFRCQTRAIKAETRDFLATLLSCTPPQCEAMSLPLQQVTTEDETAREDCRIRILEDFFTLLPNHSAVHLANSSTVRLAQVAMDRAAQRKGGIHTPQIFCNRGINGIEGSLSVATGYAQAMPEQQVYALTGDLSFFYDSNALWCSPMPANLRIMVLNDGHGSIFDTLPQPPDPWKSRHAITGTHSLRAEHMARLYGISYLCGREHLEDFINTKDTVILEIL
ncbi:MAG: 2-succinyl-5-enolpyruvyl-6-hydroxy-3-cyclohexene-1-carboxylic-acid synthase [Bacteroidaceae bacterium]|nr:2-succinyl-5-enolpyruvyl-6-hydroxy-3-cyclohexene-1-carboxylic-acid synthase [Bacteroidaceae bacterium]